MEEAAAVDSFAARYGWTVEQIQAAPQWFKARAPWVWQAKTEVAEGR